MQMAFLLVTDSLVWVKQSISFSQKYIWGWQGALEQFLTIGRSVNWGLPPPYPDGGATLKKEGVGNRLEGGAKPSYSLRT